MTVSLKQFEEFKERALIYSPHNENGIPDSDRVFHLYGLINSMLCAIHEDLEKPTKQKERLEFTLCRLEQIER